jgi:hypothetical protein
MDDETHEGDESDSSSERPVPSEITKLIMYLDHTDAPVVAINSSAGSDHDGRKCQTVRRPGTCYAF